MFDKIIVFCPADNFSFLFSFLRTLRCTFEAEIAYRVVWLLKIVGRPGRKR